LLAFIFWNWDFSIDYSRLKEKTVLSWARSRMSQTVFSKAISLRSAGWILDEGNHITQNSGLRKARAQDSLALIR
jgi:hypothetical protein